MSANYFISIAIKILQRRYLINGADVSFKDSSLSNFRVVSLSDLSVNFNGFEIFISKVSLKLNLIGVLKLNLRQAVSCIEIDNGHISLKPNGHGQKVRDRQPKDQANSIRFDINFKRVFAMVTKILFRYSGTIVMRNLSVVLKEHRFLLTNTDTTDGCLTIKGKYNSKNICVQGSVHRKTSQIILHHISIGKTFVSTNHFSILIREVDTDRNLGNSVVQVKVTTPKETFNINNGLTIKDVEVSAIISIGQRRLKTLNENFGTVNNVPFIFKFDYNLEQGLFKLYFHFEVDHNLQTALVETYNSILAPVELKGSSILKISFACSTDNVFLQKLLVETDSDNLTIVNYQALNLSLLASKYPLNLDFLTKSELFTPIHDRLYGVNYVCLDRIDDGIKKLIITTEDPDFYKHSGVDIPRVGLALAINYSERKFKKGASTITMQLARNLLLDHNKNIFRKLDEAIISVLMEKYLQIPKEQIFELYLNIIEFGPNVFGIHNACDFYFSKAPGKLTLSESIVLTYIIPRPLFFYEALISDSKILRLNLKNYVSGLLDLLKYKSDFSADELEKIDDKIVFSKNFDYTYIEIR